MCNYMKWELKSILKSNKIWFITIAAIFALEFLFLKSDTNQQGSVVQIFTFAFIIIMMISALFSFIYGTKRTIDTFKKPTFLLESMIPIPASKLLLAKYLIAIIMNILYTFIFIIGVVLVMAALTESGVIEVLGEMGEAVLEQPTYLLRIFFVMICSSTCFTAIVSTLFCSLKSEFPNGKGLGIVSFILGYFAFGFLMVLFQELFMSSIDDYLDIVLNGFCLIIVACAYFFNVYLIENRLEIYN